MWHISRYSSCDKYYLFHLNYFIISCRTDNWTLRFRRTSTGLVTLQLFMKFIILLDARCPRSKSQTVLVCESSRHICFSLRLNVLRAATWTSKHVTSQYYSPFPCIYSGWQLFPATRLCKYWKCLVQEQPGLNSNELG